MRPEQVSKILTQEFESVFDGHHTPVMLWGATGIGKSQIISQVASNHDVEIIDIAGDVCC
jgi:putative ribosome biogenesis GTPase RsgA